jgi:hypothetical protein
VSRLVRLYPQAWRDRYEDEFTALLEERPPTPGDVLDTIRGALDAHLHPSEGDAVHAPWTHRLPGLFALAAGLLWSGLYLFVAFRPYPEFGWGGILSLFLFAVLFSLPGDYMASHGRQIAIGMGLFFSSVVLASVAGWNVVGWGFIVVAYVLAICGPLTLAAIRAGVGRRGRWLLLAGAVFLPLVVLLAINALRHFSGVVVITEGSPAMYFLLLPYGLAWAFLGLRMTIRGSATIVDPPPDILEAEPEVQPA